ncbi:hypothetical protein [Arthrobacter sp. UKPF54-2]|uniref:hypothetical protein n=1 Tax=Arthrobacter sp. UKPF54-2 TaxID=2600159 RepID=UPI0021BD1800|nr:hypothetical protein [Arthrobacter sp. UKPF54-2]
MDDFNFDHEPRLNTRLASAFISEVSNIVLLGPSGTGKHISRPVWGCASPSWATSSYSRPPSTGPPTRAVVCPKSWSGSTTTI